MDHHLGRYSNQHGFPPSGLGRHRAPDLIDQLKTEFDLMVEEIASLRYQREELERKMQSQVAELANMQALLIQLQQNQSKIKKHYEDEIKRLHIQYKSEGSVINEPLSNSSNSLPGVPEYSAQHEENEGGLPKLAGLAAVAQMQYQNSDAQNTPTSNYNNGEEAFKTSSAERLTPGGSGTSGGSVGGFNIPSSAPPSSANPQSASTLPPEQDWVIGYTPGVQGISISLAHNFDHESVVCCVRFSHNGKYCATGCNQSAQIFDVETGQQLCCFKNAPANGSEDLYIRSVCFSPDGKYLACGAEDKTIRLWNIDTGKIARTFHGHTMDIYSLDYSQDNLMVSGSGDKTAKLWDVPSGRCLFTLGNDEVGPKDGVTSVALSPDARLVAAGSLDKVVRLWDSHNGYFLERYEGHDDSVYSVAFSPNGKSLASGSLDKTIKLWELGRSRARCWSTFMGHKDFVLSVSFSPDGKWLMSSSKDRSVQFWDPHTAVTHMMLRGHKNSVISVAANPVPSIQMFATGSGDYKARIWLYNNNS